MVEVVVVLDTELHRQVVGDRVSVVVVDTRQLQMDKLVVVGVAVVVMHNIVVGMHNSSAKLVVAVAAAAGRSTCCFVEKRNLNEV